VAEWQDAMWEPSPNAPTYADRAGGPYRTYRPDLLMERPLALAPDVAELAWQVEESVRQLGERPGVRGLEGLARFLLRSEAIASSRIEGLQVSPQQVGLAEIAEEESLTAESVNRTARRVAANINALRRATHELAREERLSVAGVEQLQTLLLADEPELRGIRVVQNWIGGSDYHPLTAEFVPPAPQLVDGLMADLVQYMNSAPHAPLVQAGLVHAQFETIHPFRDGNGRVGRALIHTVLVRRGLTRNAVLPVSPVLLTRSREYVQGLTDYRYRGSASGAEGVDGVSTWLRIFLRAVSMAVTQAADFASSLDELRSRWERDVAARRRGLNLRETPRADSATSRILETLQEHPVLTAGSVMRLFDVSRPAALAALDELTAAGVLVKRRLDGRTSGYLAMDVFRLITFAERQLASTRWDTSSAPPSRPAPYVPDISTG
jgi:Fic family protein